MHAAAGRMLFPLYLFVYGTLQRGLSNHGQMKSISFVSEGKTVEKYGLFVEEYPMVTRKIQQSQIFGEIYEIQDQATLDRLDAFEDHPDWYFRETCSVINLTTNETISAHLYFNDMFEINQEGLEFLPEGDYHQSRQVKDGIVSENNYKLEANKDL